MALHAGEVRYDEHGVTAAAVNLAFRLRDAASKAALASAPGVLAVIASSWVHLILPGGSMTCRAGWLPK